MGFSSLVPNTCWLPFFARQTSFSLSAVKIVRAQDWRRSAGCQVDDNSLSDCCPIRPQNRTNAVMACNRHSTPAGKIMPGRKQGGNHVRRDPDLRPPLPTNRSAPDCPPMPAQRVAQPRYVEQCGSALSQAATRNAHQQPRQSHCRACRFLHDRPCTPHQTTRVAHRAELGRVVLQSRPALGSGKPLRARIV